MEPNNHEKKRIAGIWITVTLIVVVVLAGGVFVPLNYRKYSREQGRRPDKLANIQALKRDLELVEQSGETVRLGDLRGKVWALAYVFTRCPQGCLGLTKEMDTLQKKIGDDTDFHLVSVSVDPDYDTPEILSKWTAERNIGAPNWWFVTGDKKNIREYMNKYFRFPVTENTDPGIIASQGQYVHDTRIVLVDRRGMIRGYYDVLNIRHGDFYRDRLIKDIAALKRAERNSPGLWFVGVAVALLVVLVVLIFPRISSGSAVARAKENNAPTS